MHFPVFVHTAVLNVSYSSHVTVNAAAGRAQCQITETYWNFFFLFSPYYLSVFFTHRHTPRVHHNSSLFCSLWILVLPNFASNHWLCKLLSWSPCCAFNINCADVSSLTSSAVLSGKFEWLLVISKIFTHSVINRLRQDCSYSAKALCHKI